jgi:hypothetical protein
MLGEYGESLQAFSGNFCLSLALLDLFLLSDDQETRRANCRKTSGQCHVRTTVAGVALDALS